MSNILNDEQGVYRWVYEFNLWTNPTILFTVAKVFLIAFAVVMAFLLLLLVPDLVGGTLHSWEVEGTLHMGGIFLAVVAGLTLIGYVAYAVMQGGKYCAMFTMDENGIEHRQLPREFKKAQVVGALNVLAGLASGKPAQVGLGIDTATRNTMTSTFDSVRSVKGSRALRVIKVNEPFAKNQVYVSPEDYDFVFGYIRDHCPNARVRGR